MHHAIEGVDNINILYLDKNIIPKKWYGKNNNISIARIYSDAIDLLKNKKFDIIDLGENLNSAGTGSDVLRFILNNYISCKNVVIHEQDKEIRNNMILLVKKYSNLKVSYY